MSVRLVCGMLVCLLAGAGVGGHTARAPLGHALPRYTLQQIPEHPDRYGAPNVILRVYDARTGRTAWTRRCDFVDHVAWSNDHRALAVIDFFGGDPTHRYDRAQGPWRLLLWRAGGPVRILWSLESVPADIPAIRHLHYTISANIMHFEAPNQVAWSPDKARLLIQAGWGDADDVGLLWCLNVRTLRPRLVWPARVYHDARWVGRRRIRFTAISPEGLQRVRTALVQ